MTYLSVTLVMTVRLNVPWTVTDRLIIITVKTTSKPVQVW